MKRYALLFVVLLTPSLAFAADKRPMKVEDLFAFKRVADPQISPDGKLVVYTITTVDLPANKSATSLWLAPTDKGEPRQLTNAPGKKDRHPRWSPDGKQILFESNRSGENQLWLINMDGGEAKQLTTISTDAGNAIWSRDGKQIAFVSAVYPEFSEKPFKESDELNKKKKEEIEKSPVKAKVFKKLFYRHWDEWVEDKRQHLFVMDAPSPVRSASKEESNDLLALRAREWSEPRDVTPGDRDAFPTSDTFSTGDNFTFSPDGKYLVFTAVPEKNEAWSTNYDICRVPVNPPTSRERQRPEWECLTKDNLAADSGPVFSANGKHLAYRTQKRPGFEADRWELTVVDTDESGAFTGKASSVTPDFADWVNGYIWGPDDQMLLFSADHLGAGPLFEVDLRNRKVQGFITGGGSGGIAIIFSALSGSSDGSRYCCTQAAMSKPPILLCGRTVANSSPISPHALGKDPNAELLNQLDLPRPESVQVKVDGGDMQMWILTPPGFDPKKKWPLAFLVHGGPQGAWEDGWSYRWNPELWAAQGYVVALPNPRGSTGFGQKYVDEISGDWGGKCYDDLMAGLAYMEKQDYIDKDRMAAAGASFGGYMMNWFQGHTTKFKTLITHCGVYNFDSMYATTDEIWFDEWEHGGVPWDKDKRESYEKHSPHRYAKNFKTPNLIIHNDLDFRVPVAEGLQLFNTLQRLGVPSKMINFPDEGHWVLKPKNSEYWHKEVFAWLAKYCPPGGK